MADRAPRVVVEQCPGAMAPGPLDRLSEPGRGLGVACHGVSQEPVDVVASAVRVLQPVQYPESTRANRMILKFHFEIHHD